MSYAMCNDGDVSPVIQFLFKSNVDTVFYQDHTFQLLLTLEPEEVLEQLKVVMETQEVNWQTVLSFLSTTVVCMPRFSELIRGTHD